MISSLESQHEQKRVCVQKRKVPQNVGLFPIVGIIADNSKYTETTRSEKAKEVKNWMNWLIQRNEFQRKFLLLLNFILYSNRASRKLEVDACWRRHRGVFERARRGLNAREISFEQEASVYARLLITLPRRTVAK